MIRHIVMWKLKDNAAGHTRLENARLIKQQLESLLHVVEGLKEIEVGINIAEDVDAFDLVLVSAFADEQALHAYHTHPAHLQIVPLVKEMREQRCLVDYIV